MATLKQATAPRDTSNMTLLTGSAGTPPPVARPAIPTSADPEFSSLAIAPVPPVLGTDTDAQRQYYRQGVSQLRMPPLPVASAPAAGASAASQAIVVAGPSAGLKLQVNNVDNPVQDILNLTGEGIIYGPGKGQVQIASTGDGLTHGDDTDWWNDAGFAFWRDDFKTGGLLVTNTVGDSTVGELKWDCFSGVGASSSKAGNFYHAGILNILSGTTANSSSSIFWPLAASANTSYATSPLLDYAGWKIVWVFTTPQSHSTGAASTYPLSKKQFYCGLTTPFNNTTNGGCNVANGNTARPPFFIGVRFDTDPGKTYALTSVANHSGSTTVYTGSALSLASGEAIGSNVAITGFSNAVNNGTFQVVASSSTTLTVLNNAGTVETATASAVTPAISDTTFKFESVANLNFIVNTRINNPGTVVDTGIVPAERGSYRLEMLCTTAGEIQMTLTGGVRGSGATFSATLSAIAVTSILGGPGGVGVLARGNGVGTATASNTSSPFAGLGTSALHLTDGSIIIISGATVTAYNGMWTVTDIGSNVYSFAPISGSSSSNTGTLTYNPGVVPYFAFGNDTQGSPGTATIGVDFFSWVWSPGLGGASLVTDNSRYW